MTSIPSIVLTEKDYGRLRRLRTELSRRSDAMQAASHTLEELLDLARVVRPEEVAADVVTMNSRVMFEDARTRERTTVTLTYPTNADVSSRKISILSPVGMALIGEAEGGEVELPLPHGETRRVRILSVLYQPEAAGDFES